MAHRWARRNNNSDAIVCRIKRADECALNEQLIGVEIHGTAPDKSDQKFRGTSVVLYAMFSTIYIRWKRGPSGRV